MSSLLSAEISSRRMSSKVKAQTYVPIVRASDFGNKEFVDFLVSQSQNPFLAHRIHAELDKLCKEGRRLDSTLWQIYKMARSTASRVDNTRLVDSFA